MIAWDPSLATGDPMIDAQHQELYRIVNELNEACVAGIAEDGVDDILGRLYRYTMEHFAAEEDFMVRSGYPAPDIRLHVGSHNDLRKRVSGLVEQRQRGELKTVTPVVELLRDWLSSHIFQVDRRFVTYMKEHPSGDA